MMKRIVFVPLALLCLLAMPALADDPVPEPAQPAVTSPDSGQPTADVDPVDAAGKIIDDATKKIDEDPGGAMNLIIDLAKSGRWGLFVGVLIMFLVWATRKFIWKVIKPNILPWLTLGLALVASVAVGLVAGNVWWQIIIDLFSTGGTGALLWSAVFKHFMKPKEESTPA